MTQSSGLFSLLKIANSPLLSQFLHDCVDDLVGLKKTNFDNYNGDLEWTLDDFNGARKSVHDLFVEAAINDELPVKVDLELTTQEELKNCFEIRKNDIFGGIIKKEILKTGHTFVKNYDWQLRWILGSSKYVSLHEPVVKVNFHHLEQKYEDTAKEDVTSFEIDIEKLDLLIEQLVTVCNEIKI